MKTCSKCKIPKKLEKFSKRTRSKDRLEGSCKDCINIKNKNYYKSNKIYFTEYRKEYYKENKDYYTKNNRNRSKEENDLNNRKQIEKGNKAKWSKKQRKINIQFKIKQTLGSRLHSALKGKIKKTIKTQELLDCTAKDLKKQFISQFLPEMNFLNYGRVWEIDHIIPCDSFDLTKEEEQRKCFHHTNLFPRFKTTEIAESFGYYNYIGNRNKSNKII